MKLPVDLKQAYRLLNHGPTVIVTSAAGGRRNIMAAAWSMPLDFNPPKITVVIDKSTFSRGLIESSGEFVLNIPGRSLAQATLQVGSCSGHDTDKFATFGLDTFAGDQVAAPLLAGCLAWLECKLVPEPHNQQVYDLFIGEVVAAWADSAAFSEGRWVLEAGSERSIHYVAGGAFFETGEAFNVEV